MKSQVVVILALLVGTICAQSNETVQEPSSTLQEESESSNTEEPSSTFQEESESSNTEEPSSTFQEESESSNTEEPSSSLNCQNSCERKNRFCEVFQEENCDCTEVCCDLPRCEGSEIDWEHCESCSDCPCLPQTSSSSSYESSSSEDCPESCPFSDSIFCYSGRINGCYCETVCCEPPICEVGVDWANCHSCYDCPCLSISDSSETSSEISSWSSETSPSSPECSAMCPETSPSSPECSAMCPSYPGHYCYGMLDINNACQTFCCATPVCKETGLVDWSQCWYCDQCPCLTSSPPISEVSPSPDCSIPCPSYYGDPFCFLMKIEDCSCQLACCSYPGCEGSGVDWPNCKSCFDCPCLPSSSSTPTGC